MNYRFFAAALSLSLCLMAGKMMAMESPEEQSSTRSQNPGHKAYKDAIPLDFPEQRAERRAQAEIQQARLLFKCLLGDQENLKKSKNEKLFYLDKSFPFQCGNREVTLDRFLCYRSTDSLLKREEEIEKVSIQHASTLEEFKEYYKSYVTLFNQFHRNGKFHIIDYPREKGEPLKIWISDDYSKESCLAYLKDCDNYTKKTEDTSLIPNAIIFIRDDVLLKDKFVIPDNRKVLSMRLGPLKAAHKDKNNDSNKEFFYCFEFVSKYYRNGDEDCNLF